MIELIYFGMMPIIVLVSMVIHKIGYVNMFDEIGENPFSIPFLLGGWPIVVVVGIIWAISAFLNIIADGIVKLIKRYTKDVNND